MPQVCEECFLTEKHLATMKKKMHHHPCEARMKRCHHSWRRTCVGGRGVGLTLNAKGKPTNMQAVG